MKRKTKKGQPIFLRLLAPMLLVAALEVAILFMTLTLGGVFSTLRDNALDTLDERTQNKQQPFETQMRETWGDLSAFSASMSSLLQSELARQGATLTQMQEDAALNAALVEAVAPTLISNFRHLKTTGVFLILNGIGVKGQPDTLAGIYIRDFDPNSSSTDQRDLLFLRGQSPLSSALGISLDICWAPAFQKSEGNGGEFFRLPFQAAQAGVSRDPQHYGYWCGPFALTENDTVTVMTYAVPVFGSTGEVLGVVGIDLSQNYLVSVLNTGEFARTQQGCYVLGMQTDADTIDVMVSSGQLYRQHFLPDQTTLSIQNHLDSNSILLHGSRSGRNIYGTVLPLSVYQDKGAFSAQKWVLVGLQSEEVLMSFYRRFSFVMLYTGTIALALCVVLAVASSRSMTRSISGMVRQMRQRSHQGIVHLDPIGINEIDELGLAIQQLSQDVYESASRLSNILQLTGLSVGVFEIKRDAEMAYCSSGFYQLMDCEEYPHDGECIASSELHRVLQEKLTRQVEDNVWVIRLKTGQERYIRHVRMEHRYSLLGMVMDVTSEMEERRRIEHERDYDLLTGIYNRRAFTRATEVLLDEHPERMRVAAMVMMDLDNLKFVNDTYGHDCGDKYIRSFAEALSAFEQQGPCVRGRRSGDEFYVLLYGFGTREGCRSAITQAWEQVMHQGIQLPDGGFYRFRCSGGIAWYPDHASDLHTLIHYADFAMYRVKHGAKGVLEDFDPAAYAQEAYLFNAREALNRLIDAQLIHFVFQPIVNAHTGELYGYELLMRPDVPELANPLAVVRLAKAQGQLHHIERLTWFGAMRTAQEMTDRGLLSPELRIFINSLANQDLDEESKAFVVKHYGLLLHRTVLEVTEGEDNNMDFTRRKQQFMRDHGGLVAIDDYGTGYNSEMALMLIEANIVKVDISFVRNVDKDADKQTLVKNLIRYARRKGIAVLGEGVETREELETLISFGMDYMQGYYLGKPTNEPAPVSEKVRQEIVATVKRLDAQPKGK